MLDLSAVDSDLAKNFRDVSWGAEKLSTISLFTEFTVNERMRLYEIGELISKEPQSHVVIEGEQTRGIYILLDGKVSVYKNDAGGAGMTRLAYLETGATIGELSLFDDAPRNATISCESVCVLFQLNIDSFEQFMNEFGDNCRMRFYKRCAEEMVTRFRDQNHDYVASQKLLWKHALRRN